MTPSLADYEAALLEVKTKSLIANRLNEELREAADKVNQLTDSLINARDRAIDIATSSDPIERSLTHSTALEISIYDRELVVARERFDATQSALNSANTEILNAHNRVISIARELAATAIVDTRLPP